MPVYVWKGRTTGGEIQTGELTLDSQEEALAALRKKRIIITSVREKKGDVKLSLPKFGTGVSTRDLAIFTRQFATMINAGLPLVQCLDILSKQTEKENFRAIIAQVMREVEAGNTLAESLAKKENNRVFDELFVNMVEAGEAGGILETLLDRLAMYQEKTLAIKNKIKSALIYPIAVLVVAFVVLAVIMIFVIPAFEDVFKSFGADLPAPTLVVMAMSKFFVKYWYLIFLVIGGGLYFFFES